MATRRSIRRWGLILGGVVLSGFALWLVLRELHWLPYASPNWAVIEARARALCEQRGLPYPPPRRRVVVQKGARKLQLFSGQTLLGEYPVALSSRPEGAKEREGDRKVPEGSYFVCEKHLSRRFYLFIGLSYPSIHDAERGMQQGLIDKQQADTIRAAIEAGQCPPWNTPSVGRSDCTAAVHGAIGHWAASRLTIAILRLSISCCRWVIP